MVRASAVFIAACMMLICASFGAVLYLTFGLSAIEALVAAIAALTGIAVCTIVANVGRRGASPAQIVELSRGVAELARHVVELGRRVAAMEGRVADASERAAAAAPLAAEIGEIGVLIKQLAESVSAHELALQNGRGLLLASATPAAAPEPAVAAPAQQSPARAAEPALVRPAEPGPPGGTGSERGAGGQAASAASAGGVRQVGLGFKGLGAEAAIAAVRDAIAANRLEFFLQPIVTLPQRKVRFYEAFARLRTAEGELLDAGDFIAAAEAGGLMPRIDNLMLFRCVQVARRLVAKNRDVGIFCNISASTLVDTEFFPQLTQLMEANRAIAAALVLEITQAAYRTMGPLESEGLVALMGAGFRFSMDNVADLRFEPRNLADRGFRFIKVPGALLLNHNQAGAADIHAADLAGLLRRFGIDLVAEKIEGEGMVVDLLDYDVKFGQGLLFSPPRPVRADLLQPATVEAASRCTAEERPAPRPADRPGVAPSPKSLDPRMIVPQRATGLAQIARAAGGR